MSFLLLPSYQWRQSLSALGWSFRSEDQLLFCVHSTHPKHSMTVHQDYKAEVENTTCSPLVVMLESLCHEKSKCWNSQEGHIWTLGKTNQIIVQAPVPVLGWVCVCIYMFIYIPSNSGHSVPMIYPYIWCMTALLPTGAYTTPMVCSCWLQCRMNCSSAATQSLSSMMPIMGERCICTHLKTFQVAVW